MLQTCCYRLSLKTGAMIFGIFFSVNSLFHLFVGFFYFISKTRFYQDEIPQGLAVGSLVIGSAQLIANLALIEGVIKRSRWRLSLWELVHAALLAVYAAAIATLWATLLYGVEFPALRRLCRQLLVALIVLVTLHGALQVYALIVVESLRRKFLKEAPPAIWTTYKPLQKY